MRQVVCRVQLRLGQPHERTGLAADLPKGQQRALGLGNLFLQVKDLQGKGKKGKKGGGREGRERTQQLVSGENSVKNKDDHDGLKPREESEKMKKKEEKRNSTNHSFSLPPSF